jgi:hypothetical protein
MPAGGGRIVANRGSYSEMREERKLGTVAEELCARRRA